MRNFRRFTRVLAVPLAVFFLLVFAQAIAAQDWITPSRALAKKIAEKLKPGQSVALSLQTLSSFPPEDAAIVNREIERELRAQGLHVKLNGKRAATGSDEGIADIRVSLAENSQGLLWVAEVGGEQDRAVVMHAVPRAAKTESLASPPAMFLQSQMLLTQENPILDLMLLGSPASSAKRLLVLEPARIELYALGPAGWQMTQAADFPGPDPPQRDPRGRLMIDLFPRDTNGKIAKRDDSFSVILPREVCRAVLRDALTVKCETIMRRPWDEREAQIWPPPDLRAASSYSVARFQVKGKEFEIDAGKDGLARLFKSDDAKGPLATFSGWGSELAGLKSGCGSGWQILATRAGDYTTRDAVQAFEIADNKAVPVSPPFEFAGPVMALRASEGKDAAFAVVKNLETGHYEAHVLSLSCGH